MSRLRGWGVGVSVVLCARVALATPVHFDNGLGNVMYSLNVDVDEYGSFGREVGPGADDEFWPSGTARLEGQTFISSSFLFVTAPFNASAALSTHAKILNHVGGGLSGPITRTVTMPNVKTGNSSHSEFEVANAPSVVIKFKLDQRLVTGTPPTTSRLEQDYTITNTGTQSASLVFHTFWDMDLYFGDQLFESDWVGAGPGLCYVYMHDPGNPSQGGSLVDGGSTLPARSYYAGKAGHVPTLGGEPFYTSDNTYHPEWMQQGMPPGWRNYVAYVGYDKMGVATQTGDGIIGMEWRFTLAVNETQTIRVRRVYGTNAVPCNVSTSCGNGSIDPGETCDEPDSATCNAATCTAPACNDGVVNAAAGEECESAGVDSIDCNGATCLHSVCGDKYVNAAAGEACDDGEDTATCNAENCQPPMCGDGIVNLAANEACEAGELCDLATCQYTYSLGGGCGGCSSNGDAAPWFLLGAIFLRRRARTRTHALPREPRCSDR